jgi:hypothetical protein
MFDDNDRASPVNHAGPAYRRFGHEVNLERYLYPADQVASQLEAAGLREICRLVRRAQGSERDDQAVLLARAD